MIIDEVTNISTKDFLTIGKKPFYNNKLVIASTPKGSAFTESYEDVYRAWKDQHEIKELKAKRTKHLNIIQLEKNPRKSPDSKDVL